MADFKLLQNPVSRKWVVSAPRRAKRPDIAKGTEPVCPFCPGKEGEEKEVYQVTSITRQTGTTSTTRSAPRDTRDTLEPRGTFSNWLIRVVPNKYPFAPVHEVIIHSPDHHKNFDQLALSEVELILQTYKHQYNEHAHKGQVYIFHNRGEAAGESLPHPHSQLAVVPFEVKMEIPTLSSALDSSIMYTVVSIKGENEKTQNPLLHNTEYFILTCPETSQWSDEVWIAPTKRGRVYGEITDAEMSDLARILQQLIRVMHRRHIEGHRMGKEEFPFNLYIYPGEDWYMRFIPRTKTLGGFEVGTGIFVNTQDPEETMEFLKENFQ